MRFNRVKLIGIWLKNWDEVSWNDLKGNFMGNRKDKSLGIRLLSTFSAFILLGAGIYIFFAGINFYSGALISASVLGLGTSSVMVGEGFMEIFLGFFEAFFDGIMEVFGGILDAISSIFGWEFAAINQPITSLPSARLRV